MNAGAPQRGFAGSSHSRDLWDANTVATASLNKRFFAGYAAAHLGQRRHSIADLAAGKKTLNSLPDSLVSASSVMGALRGMCAIWTTTGSLV